VASFVSRRSDQVFRRASHRGRRLQNRPAGATPVRRRKSCRRVRRQCAGAKPACVAGPGVDVCSIGL